MPDSSGAIWSFAGVQFFGEAKAAHATRVRKNGATLVPARCFMLHKLASPQRRTQRCSICAPATRAPSRQWRTRSWSTVVVQFGIHARSIPQPAYDTIANMLCASLRRKITVFALAETTVAVEAVTARLSSALENRFANPALSPRALATEVMLFLFSQNVSVRHLRTSSRHALRSLGEAQDKLNERKRPACRRALFWRKDEGAEQSSVSADSDFGGDQPDLYRSDRWKSKLRHYLEHETVSSQTGSRVQSKPWLTFRF